MRATLLGHEIHYEVRGADRDPSLLLMHPFPVHRGIFPPVPGARLITFDAPGAGESPVPAGPLTMDLLAGLAASLLDHLGIDRAIVGGVSMGGYAAFRFVARHPGRLQGLVLANTRPAPDTEETRRARYEMIEAARREGSAEIAHRMLPRLLGETTHRENAALAEQVRAMIEAAPAEGIARLLEALAHRPDSRPLLPEIRVPTLVIGGSEDVITPPDEIAGWASAIAGAEIRILPRAGHLACFEQPEAFAEILRAWLRSRFQRL